MARTSDRTTNTQQVNHYKTLRISYNANPAEVKSAYRGLVKEFHPDCNHHLDNHDDIASINLAYEVLSNPQARAHYDRSLGIRHSPSSSSQGVKRSPTKRETHLNEDQKIDRWCKQVYEPIIDLLEGILDSLDEQIDALANDPYDDGLMEDFEDYIDECRGSYAKAQIFFRAIPNPASAAGIASYLYHCLNAISDGIEELNYFTLNYDDQHLHTGQELWRRAEEMRYYAQRAMQNLQTS
ncbi:MAG: DnaJ domain-containing protein [Pseudanabaena sp. M158S2SP1A06QC]|jgi:molecular chaperone DnaJ|uniref:J domain-containing protein n=1 Tax=Pseudanabaena mucicola TaxID=71190 RepID=UPI002577E11B|nr:J domain-containing protein [Pseudanabaena mucicola]MCA6571913.1 DnaJ domain-containing protein [Pseudanabaena sp. M53BS1SP1A06MG]MCA6582134.1 DnaJ domain-containing protein [Pseudanabaena sp. M34BS1SP1A06MG]MCA6585394.1 DnaJ domain-containing protein [Pseudanabaena sp. M051S1SP1A06QC]MCA6588088.1 DnaJ domain-containing protein [Pseudanabaena sp. M109S1SP1A06QC]MCA6591678.1 DnaJ domain-containing protein [Pseudanabaena sp. M38BS1SP1A06MG]MCA6597051.1 DnaJ domain-containing protein [Pseudan